MIHSSIDLNPDSAAVRRDLADLYALHRWVMIAFPAVLPPGERVLFRLEERDGCPRLLVQSLIAWPDWNRLPAGYLRLGSPATTWGATATDDVALPCLAPGTELSFRLRANPTRREGDRGRRVALDGEAAWREWLARKGEAGGFRLRDVAATDGGTAVGYQPLDGATAAGLVRPLRFHAVEFAGRLEVTDPARLLETLRSGVGSGKGFGFGLLLVGPAD